MGRIYTLVGGCYVVGGLFAWPVGAVGLVDAGFGLIRQTRFGRHREEILVKEYEAGIALPKRIERRLKAKYFG